MNNVFRFLGILSWSKTISELSHFGWVRITKLLKFSNPYPIYL